MMRLIFFLSLISILQWVFPWWTLLPAAFMVGWIEARGRAYWVKSLTLFSFATALVWIIGAVLGDWQSEFQISSLLKELTSVPLVGLYLITGLIPLLIFMPAFMSGYLFRKAWR